MEFNEAKCSLTSSISSKQRNKPPFDLPSIKSTRKTITDFKKVMN